MVGSLCEALTAEGAADRRVADWTLTDAFGSADDLVAFAGRHKAIEVTVGAAARLGLDSAVGSRLRDAASRNSLRSMRATACAAKASQLLTEAGCFPLMLKGVALSVQTTGRLDARGVGDIDVVVAPEHLALAVATMRQTGATPRLTDATAGSQEQDHAVTVDWCGTSVDIHRRIAHSPELKPPKHQELWERSVVVDLGGSPVRTLSLPDAAVHIAVDSAHDAWSQLIRVADLARLLRLTEAGDDESPDHVARSWGASRQWALGLAMVRRLRSDIPQQDSLSEALAARTWLWLAAGRQLRLSTRLRDRATRDLYRVASAATPTYTRWWLGQSLRRIQPH